MQKEINIFSLRERVESFRYALKGLHALITTQHNAWIHAVSTVTVIGAGFFLCISNDDWIRLILAISLVWVAEALNTAMEFLCDAAIPDFHPLVEKAKDVAAGAVFISALAALIVGVLIFMPYISALI